MENTGYPCPGCGAPADLVVGCRACGRPPYPPAAEVLRLDREIVALTPRVDAARLAYQELSGRLSTVRQRRSALAARIRQEIPAPRPVAAPVPVPARPAPPAAVPVRPGGAETSTRAVQGLLFVLGGLLLGTAAVVFTAVAWAAFGVAGRALILLGVTVLALAAPLPARARGLRGTAETIAAVGLLLVLLDGYAAWSVDLLGVAGWPGSRYAALVAAVTGVVAAGYARLSRLTAPWFAAWLAAQPVLPLAVAAARPTAAGWALALTALALGDLVVVVVLRRRVAGGASRGGDAPPVAAGPAARAGVVLGWLGYGGALVLAAGCALVPLAVGRAAGTALLAGGPLLVVASALVVGAFAAGGPVLRAEATGLLVPVLAAALVRPVAAGRPGLLLLAAGLVVAALAGAVRALPARLRTGPRLGALTVAAGLGALAVVLTGLVAAATAIAAFPAWQGGRAVPVPSWGWQLPPALLLVAGAVALLAPRAARPLVGVLAATLTVLAAPAVVAVPWPAVLVADLAVAAVLLLGAVLRPRRGAVTVTVAASTAALLAGHALLVGCAAPAGAGAVLAVTAGLGVAVAALGRRGSGAQPVVAGIALAVALLAVPAGVAVALFGLGAPPWWQLRGGTAAVVLPVLAVVAVRRRWPDLRRYASAGLAVALAGVGLGPLVASGGEPVGLYAVAGALLALAAGGGARPPLALRVVGVVLAGLALLAAAPAALTVLGGLPVRPWSGAPAGTAVPVGTGRAGLVLLLLGVAAAAYARSAATPARAAAAGPTRAAAGPAGPGAGAPAYGGGSGWWLSAPAGLPFGAVALPVLLAAAGAPWPVVPAVAFGTGLAALLTAALVGVRAVLPAGARPEAGAQAVALPGARSAGAPAARAAAVLLPLGAVLGGFGFGGLLATRAGTLVGLGALVVAGIVAGIAGRSPGVRLTGWLGAVSAATGFAVTAPLAGGLPLRTAGFTVLAVAALTLHAAPALRTTPGFVDLGLVVVDERREPDNVGATTPGSTRRVAAALEGVAQGVALLALLLTGGALRHAAGVCVLWGVAVAVRVLRRGETPARRRGLAAVAAGSELLGGWLLLAAGQVAVLEAYTVPAALLALGAGLVALRHRPGLTSWLALGPGLAAALLPSLVSVLAAPDPQPLRRLALGTVAVGAVFGGAVRRWQAPVVLGAATLVPLALHELARGWDLLPRWIFLALGGLALIGLAATYERRRRDLARLRAAVARLG
ncbi:SCO7613 C-terminal domain-containing membrane protein [Micromonospora sp. NPDC049282]|uniref:SCO7613 C-terminal domain-containing membrane protein n=1 Tax=Micromonospora sp. NPDC049282 TaxID=3364269 RepID=UPI0037188376